MEQFKEIEKAKKFNNYINKIIILSGKEYSRKEILHSKRESTILDDDEYKIEKYLGYTEQYEDNVNEFIENIENLELFNAIKKLSHIEKIIILLIFSEELNRKEIADILHICTDTVSRAKLRAIRKLKEHLIRGEE